MRVVSVLPHLPMGAKRAPSVPMVFQLVYSSSATQDFWPDDLFELVEKSRRKNAEHALTGMLLFHEGQFLQLLEGPEPAVRACFAVVERDPRHDSVKVLLTGECEQRDFPEWTMGFEQPGDAWNLPPAWSTILEQGFTSRAASGHSSAAKDLLLSFQYGLSR
jgi:Sensors of blue-light using FAD